MLTIDVHLGDDIWVAIFQAMWKHRVPSSLETAYRILSEWRAIAGQIDTSVAWRAVRDRFPETNYVPTPVVARCVTLVLTTCKRLSLFLHTMTSLAELMASPLVCATLVIDDHSSDADRRVMEMTFPTVRFVYTRVKGHAVSMNTLLSLVSTRFVLYVEDDWVFVANATRLVADALEIFRSHWNDPHTRLAQVATSSRRLDRIRMCLGASQRPREWVAPNHAVGQRELQRARVWRRGPDTQDGALAWLFAQPWRVGPRSTQSAAPRL